MLRSNRLVDSSPRKLVFMQDVLGSVEIGIEDNVAGFTPEHGALPLTLLNAFANGASFGCISCGNELNSDTNFLPFVFEEVLQLEESPIGKNPIHRFLMFGFSDSFEVLQNKNTILSCAGYQTSTDYMVHVGHKPFLPASELAQMSLGRTSAFGLQPCSQTYIPFLDGKNIMPFIEPTIRCGYQIVDSSIHTNRPSNLGRNTRRTLDGNHQTELPILAFDKVALLDIPIEEFLKICRDIEFHLYTPGLGKKACGFLGEVYRAAPRIIMDGSSRESWSWGFPLNGSLNGRASVFVGYDSELGREAKLLSENWIVEMVHPERIGFFVVVARKNDEVLSDGHKRQSFIKDSSLLWKLLNYSLYGFHHGSIMDGKVFKGRLLNLTHGEDNLICKVQHQLSHRLVSKIQTRNLGRRTSGVLEPRSPQHRIRQRVGSIGIENHARPYSLISVGSSENINSRHHPTTEGKKRTRNVPTIPNPKNHSQERSSMVSKLLCRNGRSCFRTDDTKIHSRAGEGETQFLHWLKPVVSLRGIL
jgi:hypothetical protein